MKNPDEFHSDMVHTKINDGKIVIQRESKLNPKKLEKMHNAESRYMNMRIIQQQNQLKKLKKNNHCLDAASAVQQADPRNSHIIFVDNDKQR